MHAEISERPVESAGCPPLEPGSLKTFLPRSYSCNILNVLPFLTPDARVGHRTPHCYPTARPRRRLMNRLMRAALAGVLAALAGAASAADTKTVAITQIVDHPALDAARQGVQDELKAEGYTVGQNLRWLYENAQGNPGTAAQIGRTFVGKAPDVIVAISTPSAQAVVAATRDIPVIFTAVTDPLGAKLVSDLKNPGGNVTGMTDLSPIPQHLDLIHKITPNAKRIGVISNPGEANSVTLVRLLKEHAPERGMTIVEAAAPRSNDVLAAARSLVGKVHVIYL